MVGVLVKRKRLERGLTQPELALRTGLRQTYISDVEQGKIAMPRDHNLDALGKALGISRGEFYQAAGMLEGLPEPGPVSPAGVVVIQGPQGPLEVPIERVVAYVEAMPNPRHQTRLEGWRQVHDRATYERLCARLYIAWSSNSELMLDALDVAGVN